MKNPARQGVTANRELYLIQVAIFTKTPEFLSPEAT